MRYLLWFFLSLHLLPAIAQDKRLTLFVDPDCHNCQYVIQTLSSEGIHFDQQLVTDMETEMRMWEILEGIGVEQMVFMPVVLIDDIVVFPVYENGKIQRIGHRTFFPKLVEYLKHNTALPYTYAGQDTRTLQQATHHMYEAGKFYMVALTSRNINEAVALKRKLERKGFKNTKIVSQPPFHKVVIDQFGNYNVAIQKIASLPDNVPNVWIETASETFSVAHKKEETDNYHVISHSFSQKVNAEKKLKELHNNGLLHAHIVGNAQLFRVSLKSFSQLDAALSYLESKKSSFPQAWIIKL